MNLAKNRNEIDPKFKWDIEKIYADTETWNKEFQEIKTLAPKLKEYEGKLNNAETLYEFLQLEEKVSRKLYLLLIYAFLKSDEDTTQNQYQALKSKIQAFAAEFGSYVSFMNPELLSLPEGTMEKFLEEKEELKLYKFMIEDLLRNKPHVLSQKEEALLASAEDIFGAPQNIYNIFSNADLKFPQITNEEGEKVDFTESSYFKYIISKNRDVRKEAFEALFGTYESFKNTIATSLTASTKKFAFMAKTKKFNSSIEYALSPLNIPVSVYDNLIETINNNLNLLHRYVDVKKKLLGVDELHMYDLYVPVIDVPDMHIEFQEGVDMVKEGIKPLGEEYLNIFQEGIDNRWIDVYENKGKRNGAYSWGSYDTMPYVLLNYNFKYNDVSTLAHEMGHSLHSYYSRKEQPFVYSNYTLFCAEVASTVNECLLINDRISKETDKKKKLYYINEQLEQIRGTVFRQTMFAEFERETHKLIDAGTPLTSEELNDIYYNLNKKYYGDKMVIDDLIKVEWARIPHFYRDFYVYQYSTGYSAAMSFTSAILRDGEEAVERYKGFLKSGGSDYSINILKKAGVDMTTTKPVQDTMDRFKELLDMLEAEL
ncbi:oligoendopeptidase F [Oceanirhabdus sp. W0125-5]|uniref:oligoendopeptidase F n=1 Tax=Oceanirhabdus sp. W0125-5 TaxID=2999116 RepID=UPI0022F2C2AC|nr:oligoendopeptidase F [Oceanirhabdus sp. W0125-5]WBW99681.1 oligoendopeptidase F [Oceanirhabdus sp. W0125-5]